MIRFLPFILIPVLILGALGYWRFTASQKSLATPQAQSETDSQTLMEVPKTLPQASLEDRISSLEDTNLKLVAEINKLKAAPLSSPDSAAADTQASLTELKVRVSALEKASPTTSTASKYPLYIPLGAGGGPWADQDWHTLTEYQAPINADNYSGYSGMQLEANFRLTEAAGTGSIRLYNVTDGSVVSSSQLDTTGTAFGVQTSGSFKLPAGQKTYTIQVKSTSSKDIFVQSARIKVNF
ncbi:MAG: hypothetical protein ACD_38C00032G0005 [uncultured bacterium]|uniref:Uncharacterized protein n=1 Tax=Candidatus Daviesbacteria bacterium GW2011_GWC2_40_12 TaxID=1618431 RepID=A0A0G0QWP4_9BACT|nr:MAG: hypothetical protein ACD_38C00032G0005 [uncultured bacterium]KKR16526.1 MAG: hypothetical protein UT45_C0005G0055 [Candidatus Daviesbacteria bacterium GW2011_GWA2_39_33]KKR24521.1 MAG: hypothetical protein UT54_C0018G0021 [Candidatus Daviesbacteria bacterium GW2011_GWB1_39_5]KKR41791.1 MAG: hypothetical protein UT77_C0006G0023 [Candidatus Daviesbacteria bacterium GW2011_GWC2_40_12]OGE21131.1 MAG: hypothetical protein A2778_02800 [Candidatus Daviesbacteria bacterium RIFCSPHIGHO2_01_FULL_